LQIEVNYNQPVDLGPWLANITMLSAKFCFSIVSTAADHFRNFASILTDQITRGACALPTVDNVIQNAREFFAMFEYEVVNFDDESVGGVSLSSGASVASVASAKSTIEDYAKILSKLKESTEQMKPEELEKAVDNLVVNEPLLIKRKREDGQEDEEEEEDNQREVRPRSESLSQPEQLSQISALTDSQPEYSSEPEFGTQDGGKSHHKKSKKHHKKSKKSSKSHHNRKTKKHHKTNKSKKHHHKTNKSKTHHRKHKT